MKKWGRKKASSSSSISNVFLKQWLSRFNNTKCCEEAEPFRTKLNNISSFQSCKEDHSDDGFYWSLSFDEEMDEDDKLNVSPVSHGSFNNMLSNGAKIKELITSDREKLDSNVKINGNKRRRSKHGRKVKHSSPLTVDKDRVVEDAFRTGLDSFAIVKTSFDPEYDFRESMIEMIIEKEIKKPEELEELLACYLTLNCDEYHELIVNVFKRVWIELN